jgi:amino acid transporter
VDGSLERNKTLTYLNGLSLIVGLIIGSGIFSSPSQVNANAGSPGASLIVWAVAGLLAWTGAASYAELGGAIPLNGGSQIYLSKIFGELPGFLFTWCAVLVLKPGSAAIISIIFGEYVVRAFVGADVGDVSPWINKSVAFGGLLTVTLFNCISTRFATRIGDMFMFFKFVALLGVTVIGVIVAVTGLSSGGDANEEWKTTGWFEGTNTEISDFAVALYAGLWAFDGWDNVSAIYSFWKPFIYASLDQLRDWRVQESQPRPASGHPHSDAIGHPVISTRKRLILPRSASLYYRGKQHRRCAIRRKSLRRCRSFNPRSSRLSQLFRSS